MFRLIANIRNKHVMCVCVCMFDLLNFVCVLSSIFFGPAAQRALKCMESLPTGIT